MTFKKYELSIYNCVLLIHDGYRTLMDQAGHVCGLDVSCKMSFHDSERVILRNKLYHFLILPLALICCRVS